MLDKLVLVGALGLVGVGASPESAVSQPANVRPDVVGMVYTAEAAAVVETVDPQAHQVLLRLPDQSLVTLNAGPGLRNPDQLKPGDHVLAKYIEAAVVRLTNPKSDNGAPVSAAASAAATAGAQIHDVSKVVAVDPPRNTLSFTDANDKVQTIVLHDPATVAVLKTLKTGDPVEITYTEGVALSLTPLPA
jgi:hypothetical protein